MATKSFKPTSDGLRTRKVLDFKEITTSSPEKALCVGTKNKAGRNSNGRVTVRRRGGGSKRKYRVIDFKRDKIDIPGTIKTIEYDPNRTCNIALVVYKDGEKRYIIAPQKCVVGETIIAGKDAEIKSGNSMRLRDIPVGSIVHNIELTKGKGGQLVRSAGASAVLMAKSEKYASIKLPSGEVRFIHLECMATLGQVGNQDRRNISLGKAGVSRWLRRRPKVRGSVMNPCDHPHGGGEGKAPIGLKQPRTPWGKPTLGVKTRRKKASDRLIVKRKSRR